MLNFDDAIQAMIEGKKIRGECWGDDEFLYYDNDPNSQFHRGVYDEDGNEVPAATLIANLDSEFEIVE
jgi:hypothetical protein